MDPFKAGAVLCLPTPPGHISSAYCVGKDGARVGMNVPAHQNNENKNTRKRETDEIGD